MTVNKSLNISLTFRGVVGVPPVFLNEVFQFLKSPANVTLSLGKPLQVLCTLQGDGGGEEPPGVVWLRDSQSLDYADTNQVQVPVTEGGWLTSSELRIDHVKLSDIGRYCCMATVGRKDLMSQEGHIQLEGIPHFSVKPHDVTVVATVSLSLQCLAHGPPEPVRIIWLQNGGPLNTIQDPVSHSPSTLNITGKDCLICMPHVERIKIKSNCICHILCKQQV
ncbi:tyrosine-protein kinase receptor UFO-like [Oncorhynchus nerka]|uniref:tyrosine-protein kinase receptor UFO-like n=1 Tax=Oncorhynchus nerka TaxID=8023 RepID=UPI0031B831DB